ncbi:hypothetical protein NQ318_015902, partial [Aromia moschata]
TSRSSLEAPNLKSAIFRFFLDFGRNFQPNVLKKITELHVSVTNMLHFFEFFYSKWRSEKIIEYFNQFTLGLFTLANFYGHVCFLYFLTLFHVVPLKFNFRWWNIVINSKNHFLGSCLHLFGLNYVLSKLQFFFRIQRKNIRRKRASRDDLEV